MATAIIGLVLLVALILIAVKIGINRSPEESAEEGISGPLIHASGIYSIIRKSPRENLPQHKPTETEIRKYLASINEDLNNKPLSEHDKQVLIENWISGLEENIKVVEQGDSRGVGFYYYDFDENTQCIGCLPQILKGKFLTREEIYKFPWVIPPFHLGCVTRLVAHHGKENLRETTLTGMSPFFGFKNVPSVPNWKKAVKPA